MSTRSTIALALSQVALLGLLGCAGDVESERGLPGELPAGEAARRLLIRASLDLTGRRPAPAALERAAQSREHLAAELDALMEGGRFGLRVRDWFAASFRTRWGEWELEIAEDSVLPLEWAEVPLMFYQEAALDDLPLTNVVTADYTFAGPAIAAFEPVEGYDAAEGGWQQVRYTDGRPAAGLLATNAMWGRYLTSEANLNRARANAVSRILLCDDFLLRPVDFPRDIDLSDTEGIENAIRENQGCQACHAALDPLAAYFEPISYEPGAEGAETLTFGAGEYELGDLDVAPGYFGHPGSDLGDLGRQVAADPRFSRCAVQRVYEALIGRPAGPADADAITFHESVFRDAGLRLRPLIASILRDPVYAGKESGHGDRRRRGLPRKLMSPEVLELAVLDVTGFRPMYDGVEPVMRNDSYGLHVLGGGLDARSGNYPPQFPNPTQVMVQRWLAEAAAAWAFDENTAGEIFAGADLEAPDFDPEAAEGMLLALFGAARETDLAGARALWDELRSGGATPREAWEGVLSAFLRVPEFVTY